MSLLTQAMEKVAALECRLSQLEAENARVSRENAGLCRDLASAESREASLRQALADAESRGAAAERERDAASSKAESLSADRGRFIDRLAELEQLRAVSRREAGKDRGSGASPSADGASGQDACPGVDDDDDGLDMGSFIAEMRAEVVRLSEENRDLREQVRKSRRPLATASVATGEGNGPGLPQECPGADDVRGLDGRASTPSPECASVAEGEGKAGGFSFGRTPYASAAAMGEALAEVGRYQVDGPERRLLDDAAGFDTRGERSAFDLALQNLASESPAIRRRAARSLGTMAPLSALPSMAEALRRETDGDVAPEMAQALAACGKGAASPFLTACMEPSAPLCVRLASLEALMGLGETMSLVHAMCDASPLVRRRALVLAAGFQRPPLPEDAPESEAARRAMEGRNIRRVMERGMSDVDESVRKVACLALGVPSSSPRPARTSSFDSGSSGNSRFPAARTEAPASRQGSLPLPGLDAEPASEAPGKTVGNGADSPGTTVGYGADSPMVEGGAMAAAVSAPGLATSLDLAAVLRRLDRTISRISGVPSPASGEASAPRSGPSGFDGPSPDMTDKSAKPERAGSLEVPPVEDSAAGMAPPPEKPSAKRKAGSPPSAASTSHRSPGREAGEGGEAGRGTLPAGQTSQASQASPQSPSEAPTIVPAFAGAVGGESAPPSGKAVSTEPVSSTPGRSSGPSSPGGDRGRESASPSAVEVREEVARAIVSRVYGSLKGLTLADLLRLVRAEAPEVRQAVEILVRHGRIVRRGQRYFVP